MRRALAWALILLSGLALGAVTPPDDPFVPEQWHLSHVGTFDAWERGQGSGIVVAVVDTGVDPTHPDLVGRVTVGIDLIEPGTPPDDPNGHGTLVAGVIAAVSGNGEGGAGVAPQATIMPVRVLDAAGTGSSLEVAEGIRWAARNGADIINLSLAETPGLLGGGGIVGSDVEAAITEAHALGAMVVAASGNEGRVTTPYNPATQVVVVGASDRQDRVWAHSNRDDRTLFAPGIEIISTHVGGGYARADGTSFSTPIVSAGAAILRGAGFTVQQTRDRLYATARPGAGAGRVDIAAAASAVAVTEGTPPPQPVPAPAPQPQTPPPPGPAPAPPPPAVEPVPQPEPVPVAVPTATPLLPAETVPEPEPTEPEPTEPEPTEPDTSEPAFPEDTDLALVVPIDNPRGGRTQPPAALVPASIALLLLLANIAGHAAWARVGTDGPPLVVWRRP